MKKITWLLAFIFLSPFSFAQGIVTDWYGILKTPGGIPVHLIFHISKTADIYSTTMDSPDQNAKGLQADSTFFTDNQLTIKALRFRLTYTGTYLPDSNKINGIFNQGPFKMPLVLINKPSAELVNLTGKKPQDPIDFPYKQEEITFTNPVAGDKLAGTLTLPADGKATKVVILITGSGPQNRDEELKGHRPFLVWSDWLTRHGIAVLRYDDRGFANSTGSFTTATTADFADDAEAAVNYIKSRPELKNLAIGLMGHSEGGIIAPMVAARNKNVKFVVLLAGPGIPLVDMMTRQAEDQLRLAGAPEAAIKQSAAISRKLYILIAENSSLTLPELKAKVDTLIYHDLGRLPNMNAKAIKEAADGADGQLLAPWYRHFLALNPQDYLIKLKCPVLAIDGTKDMQVNAEANLAGIKASLQKGGNKHFETVLMPGLNHLMQPAQTGAVEEYSQIKITVDPAVLNKVSTWINDL